MEARGKLDHNGWLNKEGGGAVKSWKKRWCSIEKSELVYYKKEGVCRLSVVVRLKSYSLENW